VRVPTVLHSSALLPNGMVLVCVRVSLERESRTHIKYATEEFIEAVRTLAPKQRLRGDTALRFEGGARSDGGKMSSCVLTRCQDLSGLQFLEMTCALCAFTNIIA
jgi:hypothetical protein